ncbi:unnamed protein product, partial [Ectocarpus fasciculatus]
MLGIHATPTVLLYCSGQLMDEFTCAGDPGPRVGKRKKLSTGGDGGQSGDEASIPEEQSEKPPVERSRERHQERSEKRPSPAVMDNLGLR